MLLYIRIRNQKCDLKNLTRKLIKPTDIFNETSSTVRTTTTTEEVVDLDGGSGEIPEGEKEIETSRCRADDVVRCEDGSRSICADQLCDGNRDCNDGADERNCSSTSSFGTVQAITNSLWCWDC